MLLYWSLLSATTTPLSTLPSAVSYLIDRGKERGGGGNFDCRHNAIYRLNLEDCEVE